MLEQDVLQSFEFSCDLVLIRNIIFLSWSLVGERNHSIPNCLSSLSSAPVRIDSVGILKLRNADIELMYGQTSTGRRKTRVRLVFRVHIPQAGGQLVSLQVASHPIECCESCQLLYTMLFPHLLRVSFHRPTAAFHSFQTQRQ